MFFPLLLNVCCIFLMVLPGYLARKRCWIRAGGVKSLSNIQVKTIYPCLIISSITRNYTLDSLFNSWTLPTTSFGIMLTGYIVGNSVCMLMRFKQQQDKTAFLFQMTINNYSFFPMALIATLYGLDAVAMLIFSTIGAEVAVWTLGVFILNGHKIEKENLKHLVSPPLVAMYIAIGLLAVFKWTGFDQQLLTDRINGGFIFQLHSTLTTMGLATVPMAMIIAGARLATITTRDVMNRLVWFICLVRLIVIPLVAVGLMRLLPLSAEVMRIMTIVAVMPVSLSSLMLSELYGGNKRLINGSVLLAHLLALLTVPLMLMLLLED